jgi:CheY-like chemotaxis protein
MAEDHLLSQKLSERLLTHLGMKMVLVDNGLLAVQKVKDQPFDIIFLDLHMPVMDGIQAAQTIRRFNTKTPIIGLTANAFFEERSQCFLAGMNDLLIKPFDQETLKNMLAKWIPEE